MKIIYIIFFASLLIPQLVFQVLGIMGLPISITLNTTGAWIYWWIISILSLIWNIFGFICLLGYLFEYLLSHPHQDTKEGEK